MTPVIRALISLPQRRRHSDALRTNLPWTPAEDRRLLYSVERMESRKVKPWQHDPTIDWSVIAKRHQRSHLAVRARLSLIRSAARIAHGVGR